MRSGSTQLLNFNQNAGTYYNYGVIELLFSTDGVLIYRNNMGGIYAVRPENKSENLCLIKDGGSSASGLALSKSGHLYAYDSRSSAIVIILKVIEKIKHSEPLESIAV